MCSPHASGCGWDGSASNRPARRLHESVAGDASSETTVITPATGHEQRLNPGIAGTVQRSTGTAAGEDRQRHHHLERPTGKIQSEFPGEFKGKTLNDLRKKCGIK